MTVQELIAALREMPQEAPIVTRNQWGDLREIAVRVTPVRACDSYGRYGTAPENGDGRDVWVADLDAIEIVPVW